MHYPFLNKIKKLHNPETKYDINLNDMDSRFMKNKKGISCYNYNLQVATDDKYHFIITIGYCRSIKTVFKRFILFR